MQVPIYGHLLIIHLGQRLRTDNTRCTWCRAVRPSTLAVSMSVPLEIRFLTSSLSPAAQAARNTQPSLNPILLFLRFKSPGSRNVSLSCHRFNCSALFIRAELDLVSSDMLAAELDCPPAEAGLVARSHHLVVGRVAPAAGSGLMMMELGCAAQTGLERGSGPHRLALRPHSCSLLSDV